MVQSKDSLVPEGWPAAILRAAERIEFYKQASGANSIGAIVSAQATNEEIFALKRLVTETIGSRHLAGVSYSPPGASGDDDLLIRANKNANTRGLIALGIDLGAIDKMTAAVASGELKMLFLLRADLVRALGEADFIRRFGALDYLIVLDTDSNETVRMANQVLPIAAYPEFDGTFTNFQGLVQRFNKAFDPPGQAMPAIELIARIGHALDGIDRASSLKELFPEIASSEPAFNGLTLESLKPHGAMLSTGAATQSSANP
jgi:NADH-quinone oxidoreductase subunit G